jgi:hypothetical protein
LVQFLFLDPLNHRDFATGGMFNVSIAVTCCVNFKKLSSNCSKIKQRSFALVSLVCFPACLGWLVCNFYSLILSTIGTFLREVFSMQQ